MFDDMEHNSKQCPLLFLSSKHELTQFHVAHCCNPPMHSLNSKRYTAKVAVPPYQSAIYIPISKSSHIGNCIEIYCYIWCEGVLADQSAALLPLPVQYKLIRLRLDLCYYCCYCCTQTCKSCKLREH